MHRLLGVGLAMLLTATAWSQAPNPYLTPPPRMPVPFPTQVPAPSAMPHLLWPNLLYVKFNGPEGLKLTLFPEGGKAQTFDMPATVGLRPGYRYRAMISGHPKYPKLVLTPTLEVRGSLLLADRLRAADFPIGLYFSDEDFASVDSGVLVTKIAVIEPPDQAVPEASTPERPLRLDLRGRRKIGRAHVS